MALTTSLSSVLAATLSKTSGMTTPQSALRAQLSDSLSDGTGDNQADLMYQTKVTITAGGVQTFDLRGVLQDDFGQTLTFAKLRAFYVRNTSQDANSSIEVRGAATNGVTFLGTGNVDLGPEGAMVLWWPAAGAPTVTDTSDQLEIANTGTVDTTVELVIIGTSL